MANYRMGWLPDRPDFRDFSLGKFITEYNKQNSTEKIKLVTAILQKDNTLKIVDEKNSEAQPSLVVPVQSKDLLCDIQLPKSIDLRQWFSPIKDQGEINACTAIAGAALVEYFERKIMGEYRDISSLFLYKITRNLMRLTDDAGASLHSTMKAMALFGILPEEYWPYKVAAFDEEPPAFCYAYAQNYQALNYFRLDLPHLSKQLVLMQIKAFLMAELPAMFGFTAYSSIFDKTVSKTGKIPYPNSNRGEKILGGHAVVAVGYDDYKTIQHPTENKVTVGAFRIRNCWGEDWGEDGYGWLPYDYVLNGLAIDWWSLLKNEWVDELLFNLTDDITFVLIGGNDGENPHDPVDTHDSTDDKTEKVSTNGKTKKI